MKKIWKKRLKKAFEKGDINSIFLSGTLILGALATLFSEIIFSALFGFGEMAVAGWTFGLTFLMIVIGFLGHDVFPKESAYDREIYEDERKQFVKEKETIQKEKMRYLNELKNMVFDLNDEENNSNVVSSISNTIETIMTILNKGRLDAKEEHYLTHTLPYHLKETLHIYMQLTEENQFNMASKIVNLVENKQSELENRFVHQHQKQLLTHLEKRMELLQVEDY